MTPRGAQYLDQRIEHNKKAVGACNRKDDAHNKKVSADLNRQLRSASSGIRYTEPERRLADRVHGAVATIDFREYASVLSYARIDEIFRRDMPVTFLFPLVVNYVAHRRIRGFRPGWSVLGNAEELWIDPDWEKRAVEEGGS